METNEAVLPRRAGMTRAEWRRRRERQRRRVLRTFTAVRMITIVLTTILYCSFALSVTPGAEMIVSPEIETAITIEPITSEFIPETKVETVLGLEMVAPEIVIIETPELDLPDLDLGIETEDEPLIPMATIEVIQETPVPSTPVPAKRYNVTLTESQRDYVAAVLMTEGGVDTFDGKCAIVEVFFARLERPGFPNTIEGIFSPDQFHGLRNLYCDPTSDECYRAVDAVLDGYYVLPEPLEDGRMVVFFRKNGWENKWHAGTFGAHNFCYEYKWN